jgi:hypothetical protein
MKESTQILIFEFECLWSDSRKLGSDVVGYITVKQSYWNWNHPKIYFRTQIMIK